MSFPLANALTYGIECHHCDCRCLVIASEETPLDRSDLDPGPYCPRCGSDDLTVRTVPTEEP